MKVTSIELYNPSNTFQLFAVLSFKDPSSQNPYIAKAIVGLDASEIVSKFYGVQSSSNVKYYNLSLVKRDIVLRIGLNPYFATQTYSDLRDALYKMISISRTGKVGLRIKNGSNEIATIEGFISKFEVPHFSEIAEVQLTLECDDPLLHGPIVVEDITHVPGPVDPNIIIDDMFSTAPHGFKFQVTVSQAMTSFNIYDINTPEIKFEVIPGTIGGQNGFLINDHIHFSSETDNKYIYLVRGGVTTYLADKVTSDSTWPILFPGENRFYLFSGNVTWEAVSHRPAYWGV